MEHWRVIPGYEGLYEASNTGKIKSLKRVIVRKNGRKQSWPEKILNQTLMKDGYMAVGLYNLGKSITYKVHQLVAMAFHNHEPCGFKLVVGHKNHIKTDNRPENLEIITNRQNTSQSHIKSKSKFVGVTFDKTISKWISRIRIGKRRTNLGRFNCETKAWIAYQCEINKMNK